MGSTVTARTTAHKRRLAAGVTKTKRNTNKRGATWQRVVSAIHSAASCRQRSNPHRRRARGTLRLTLDSLLAPLSPTLMPVAEVDWREGCQSLMAEGGKYVAQTWWMPQLALPVAEYTSGSPCSAALRVDAPSPTRHWHRDPGRRRAQHHHHHRDSDDLSCNRGEYLP